MGPPSPYRPPPPTRDRARQPRHRARRSQYRTRRRVVALVLTAVVAAAVVITVQATRAPSIAPFRARIVAAAESQLGYRTDPANTYCNKFSAYWYSGTPCGSGGRAEEWCADFAAWAWKQGGAAVDYQFVHGDLNSSSASFYEWGETHGTWHPVGSGYTPQPGDAAVYGLDAATSIADHVAIVTGYDPGAAGPDVVNGDGDHTGFSVVEADSDQVDADTHGGGEPLSGYVSPIPAA